MTVDAILTIDPQSYLEAARERARRGARLLDLYDKDWYTGIDLESLDLQYCDQCVLGQYMVRGYSADMPADIVQAVVESHPRRILDRLDVDIDIEYLDEAAHVFGFDVDYAQPIFERHLCSDTGCTDDIIDGCLAQNAMYSALTIAWTYEIQDRRQVALSSFVDGEPV